MDRLDRTNNAKGYPYYGQNVGILVLNSKSKRFVGDLGHAGTFDYQVQYEVMDFTFNDLTEKSEAIFDKIASACRSLVAKGAKTILGDCGLLSLYQSEVHQMVSVPVGLSSLVQIPTVWELIGRQGTIGIITGHSAYLKKAHLQASGWREDISIAVKGLEVFDHFNEAIIEGNVTPNTDKMEKLLLHAISDLMTEYKDVKAVILECSNLASYAYSCAECFDIPIFDALTLANYLASAVAPKRLL